ncbi:MAG TPA: lipopolysaccharide biosynthesis protein [Bacteroidales bacterium]|nr:lipopolysaccharide biosynthesis protein [Bacteroidales bacterium]
MVISICLLRRLHFFFTFELNYSYRIIIVEESDLKRKTIKGFFWSSLESILSQGQGIIFGIFLARMLSPDEFGLIGMITIFISISQVFVDSGLSQSLIRKQNCTTTDYSTIFWVNLVIGIICYLLIWIAAPSIAAFYETPQLIAITRVTSLSIIIGSFTLIQQTILTKDVDFKTLTKSSTIGTFVSGVASLALAFYGFGVWSLVWRSIINQAVRSAILWGQNRWKPVPEYSKATLREHFRFGSNILVISIISAIYRNISNLIIGKSYSEKILGYYTNADQYSTMPSSTITSITSKVSYPVLSGMQDDDIKLKANIKKLITNIMYISFVVMFGLAAIAKPLFGVVLGEKWLPSVVMFQALCLAYSISPMHVINQNIMKVKGRTDLFLRTEIIKYVIFTPLLILGAIFGITVLIGGIVLFYWIGYTVIAFYSKRLIGYSMKMQSMDFLPLLGISLFPAFITWGIGIIFNLTPLLLLGVQIIAYPCLVLLLSIIFRVPAFYEIKVILSDKLTIANFMKTFNPD